MKTIKALLALMMLLIPVCAAAQEARELTADCVITSGHVRTTSAHDNDYTTAWRSERVRRPYLEFQLPEGETAGWLYVCFADMPQSWAVEEKIDGKWQVVADGSTDYIHALVELNGQNRFRIVENSGITTRLKLNEVFVFGAGDLPDWVQRWEPTVEKADLLVLATHPDDELIFFGGTIPTYAVEQKKNVVVAYMSYATAARRSELLNGLWHMGVRNYPVIGTFGDSYSTHMDDMYARWGKEKVRRYVMGLIRQYKPDVMVTHDKGGEYGHGAHKVTSDASVYCVENAADASVLPALAEAYGTWTVKKLYLHMVMKTSSTWIGTCRWTAWAERRASSSRRKRFCCMSPSRRRAMSLPTKGRRATPNFRSYIPKSGRMPSAGTSLKTWNNEKAVASATLGR